jgi:tRNA(Ile)-lysidine synthase
VRAACKKLGIACIVGKNTRKPPRTGSLEDFARNLRQTFFVKTAQLIKADAVALAHTRDDLAETVLMRLLRGTGLDGLRAILPRRRIRSVIFIRPLLSVTRRQVESFLKGMKVPFVTDPTNASRDIHRNLIRLKVIPALEKMTREDLKARLASLAQTAGVDYDLIEQMALSLLKKRFSLSKGLNTRGWPEIHPALRRMVLRLAYETAAREHEPLPLNHIDALDRMLLIARDSRLSLANDRQAVLCKGSLKFF